MPSPSSPVPRLSSVPSDVFTVHTIASTSSLRPLVPALRERDGRQSRPLLGDVIATTSQPIDQQPANSMAVPRRSAIMPASSPSSSILQVVRVGQSKRANKKRERTRAKDAAAIFARSSLLSVASPSTPSPVLPFRLRLRFLLFFALISSARSHLFALPSSSSSFLALLPAE